MEVSHRFGLKTAKWPVSQCVDESAKQFSSSRNI